MARAKKIIRKSEREALKERRRSGEFKQDKKDARAAGLSRGDARKRAKRLSRVQALSKRKGMRADMAAKRNEDASVNKMFADRRRMEARRGGQELAYAIDKPLSPAKQRENAPGGTPTKRLNGNENVSFDNKKGMYKITGADGYVRYSKSKPAMYGAKVKAVKKAKNGGKITDPPTKKKTKAGQLNPPPLGRKKTQGGQLNSAPLRRKKTQGGQLNPPSSSDKKIKKTVRDVKKAKAGAALKSVPSKAKGLSKLPKGVRNKMGYMKHGGKVGDPPKKTKKELYEINEKRYKSIRKAMTDKDGNFKSEDDVEKFKSMFRGNKRPETSARMDNTRTPKIRVKKK